MRNFLTLLFVVACGGSPAADPAIPGLSIYDEFPAVAQPLLKKSYLAEIKRREKIVNFTKSAIAKAKSTGKEAAKSQHEDAKKLLADLKDTNDPPFVGIRLEDWRGPPKIEPILGGLGTALVTQHKWSVGDIGIAPEALRLIQVIDPTEALMERDLGPNLGTTRILLKGISTKGWTDGDGDKVYPGALWVSGTETYQSVGGGSSTVLVVEPFDWKRYRESIKKVAK